MRTIENQIIFHIDNCSGNTVRKDVCKQIGETVNQYFSYKRRGFVSIIGNAKLSTSRGNRAKLITRVYMHHIIGCNRKNNR